MIPVNRPVITDGDLEKVTNALENTWISGETPPVRELERLLGEVIGSRHVVAVTSGTTALDLAIEALDIRKGQECIVPAFTIISSVSNLLRKGAILKLVDADPVTWSMNSRIATEVMDRNTRLLIPVHIYGLSTDMDSIMEKAQEANTFVLEDAAEALGVKYRGRQCGSIGGAGVFSFYANKIVTGGEGGALVTDDFEFAEKVRSFRNLCFDPSTRFMHKNLGWNARMPGLSAALISSQLSRLNSLVQLKKAKGKRYREGLANHPWFEFQPSTTENGENGYWVFGLVLNSESPYDAQEFQDLLKAKGIETRRFFCPIHLQPLDLKKQIIQTDSLKISEKLWNRGLYLPSGIGTTSEEIDITIQLLWDISK
jgi:perosamine synthetase